MALTLVEAAKRALEGGNVLRAGIINTYAQSSDILRVLPFESIAGNALRYNQEQTLPGIGFRGVNGSYTESTGILNPIVEPLVIAGGDLDVDKFILKTMGEEQRGTQEAMKVKALAHKWTQTFLKGDSTTVAAGFDGLQVRITGNQLIDNGSTAGGDALSLAKLDELIDAVVNPTHLIMNKAMRRRLTQAARSYTIGGFITYTVDAFGRQVTRYNDLEILIADEDNTGTQILSFDEAAASGDSLCTSIYCISATDDGVKGIQNGEMDVTDLGELQTKPCKRTRVEWYSGIAIFHPKGGARLRYIKNAAVAV
jgi:hypothetical protein